VTVRPIQPEQRRAAKLVGFLYVIQMAVAVFGESFVRRALVMRGDAAKTAENLLAHEGLFRLSIAGDLLVYVTVILLVWGLWVVVEPVGRRLALLAVLFRLAENAVLCMATVQSLVMLRLLKGSDSLSALSSDQRRALAMLAYTTQGLGMSVAFVLLGCGSAVFAWLLWKSRYVPRWISAWGIFGSLVLSLGTVAIALFPSLGVVGLAYMAPIGIYEVGLGVWLIVRGIR
jgi:hypothetical protein